MYLYSLTLQSAATENSFSEIACIILKHAFIGIKKSLLYSSSFMLQFQTYNASACFLPWNTCALNLGCCSFNTSAPYHDITSCSDAHKLAAVCGSDVPGVALCAILDHYFIVIHGHAARWAIHRSLLQLHHQSKLMVSKAHGGQCAMMLSKNVQRGQATYAIQMGLFGHGAMRAHAYSPH